MRKILLAFLLCLGPVTASLAQQAELTHLPGFGFDGVRSVNGEIYYLLYGERNKPNNFYLELYNQELKLLSKTPVTLGRIHDTPEAKKIGDYYLFYFNSDKDGFIYQFDKQGKELKRHTVQAPSSSDNIAYIEPAGGQDFYLIRIVKEKKKGLEVARYNNQLQEMWQKRFIPEKGQLRIDMTAGNASQVCVVADYSKEGKEVICLDGSNGIEKYRKPVATPELDLNLQQSVIDPKGNLVVAGTYKEPKGKPSAGLFMASYKPDGQPNFETKTPFTPELEEKIRSRSTSPIYGNEFSHNFKMSALFEEQGSYQIVAETFQWFQASSGAYTRVGGAPAPSGAPNTNPGKLFLKDFVVLRSDASGKLNVVNRIPKPVKAMHGDGTIINAQGAESVTKTLNKLDFFTFRFMHQPTASQTPEIVFLNYNQNMLYANAARLTDQRDNIFRRTYLNHSLVPDEAERGEFTFIDVKDDFQNPQLSLLYTNILPHKPGKFLFYHYDPKRNALNMEVKDIPVQ